MKKTDKEIELESKIVELDNKIKETKELLRKHSEFLKRVLNDKKNMVEQDKNSIYFKGLKSQSEFQLEMFEELERYINQVLTYVL